jgi:hypothetical protein
VVLIFPIVSDARKSVVTIIETLPEMPLDHKSRCSLICARSSSRTLSEAVLRILKDEVAYSD